MLPRDFRKIKVNAVGLDFGSAEKGRIIVQIMAFAESRGVLRTFVGGTSLVTARTLVEGLNTEALHFRILNWLAE